MESNQYKKDGHTQKKYEDNKWEFLVLLYFSNDFGHFLNENKLKWIDHSAEIPPQPDIEIVDENGNHVCWIELEMQDVKNISGANVMLPDWFHRKSYYCQKNTPCYILTYRSDHRHLKIVNAKNIDWTKTVRTVNGEEMNGLKEGCREGLDKSEEFKLHILKLKGEIK